MFQSLGEKFDSLLRKLQGQGRITERNIEEALRDVRLALLEADVNLDVVRDFVEAVKRDALGEEVLRSLTPEQHFIKLVHRELVRALGGAPARRSRRRAPRAPTPCCSTPLAARRSTRSSCGSSSGSSPPSARARCSSSPTR
ncbi:MAG: hypothetical protein E6J83_03885 [Deltaproteobacteria bacterium]|nr:MAG: hypothetical protein E6J83_03885 [Deltaproteobacteria bacterium]